MGDIFHIIYKHDEGCKCLLTRNMADCNCDVEMIVEKSQNMEFTENKVKEDMKNYRQRVQDNN